MMNICQFTERDIEIVIDDLFSKNKAFSSVEEAYQQLAKSMCEKFKNQDGKSCFILSRIYHSFDFFVLPASLQQIAQEIWKEQATENSKFITLMATYGDEPAWCDRTQSKGHKAILLNPDTLTKIPMVSRLIQQIGFNLGALLGTEEKGINLEGLEGSFGIFYVPNASGSPYIPAQDFVTQYKVESVLGTGVMLPTGDISVYIGFCRTYVEQEVAANIASLMSLFWQRAHTLLDKHGMFST